MHLVLNGQQRPIPADWADETLLFLIREHFGLVGAKFGCGAGLCGACTVLADGEAVRSCQIRAADAAGSEVVTIEGLAQSGFANSGHDALRDGLHRLQHAWLELAVPQCGYCQAGQIMSAAGLLARNPKPGVAEIEAAMAGNLCRCGTYGRIRAAILKAAEVA